MFARCLLDRVNGVLRRSVHALQWLCCACDRTLCATQREFRLQMSNAGQKVDTFAQTEFSTVAVKVDRFLRLRDRRLAAARAAERRNEIHREFGNLLDPGAAKSD